MIPRMVVPELKAALKSSPAVALLGPRQCGKTTLARSMSGIYFDLEQQEDRLRLDLAWDQIVKGKSLVVLDEAQSWPAVFEKLRGAIDADRKRRGRFLLLGSVSPAMMVHVSESLAGRLALVELSPFLMPEISTDQSDRLWQLGGYPDGGIIDPGQYPRWQRDYLSILTQRDLPNWGLPAKPQTTDRLIRMLAALQGQAWNASQVGQSMGLDQKTVAGYLDYLVGAYLIRRLPAYAANIKKRLVKSPRIYWRDTGLLHSLLNVPDMDSLLVQPWVGASWEGFVIEQILGVLTAAGRSVQAYHFRTSDQREIDLVLDFGKDLWAVEIKLTTSPSSADMDRLNNTADLINAGRRFLISRTKTSTFGIERSSCNLPDLLSHFIK